MQTVEKMTEPSATEEKTIEMKTIETVTTTEIVSGGDGDGETVQTTETHEIKTEITSEPEPASNGENIDTNKLTEPENNEMTGKKW